MSDMQVAPSAPEAPPQSHEGPRDPIGEHFGVEGLMDVGPSAGKLSGKPLKIAPIRDDKGKFTGARVPQATPPAAPASQDDFAQERGEAQQVEAAPTAEGEAPPETAEAAEETPKLTELPGVLEVEGHTFKSMEDLTNFIRRQTAAQSATDQKNAVLERSLDELRSYLQNTGLINQIDFSKDPTDKAPDSKPAASAPLFDKTLLEDADLLSQIGEDAKRSDGAGPYIAAMRVAQRLEQMVNKAVDSLRQELSTSIQPHQQFLNAIESTTKTASFLAERAMATDNGRLLYPDIRDKKNAAEIVKILDQRFPDPNQALNPENFHIAYLLWREKKGTGDPTPKYEVPGKGPSDAVVRSAAAAVSGTTQSPKLGATPKVKTPEEAAKDVLRSTPVTRGGFRV